MLAYLNRLHHTLNTWITRLGYDALRFISGVTLKLGFQFQVTGAEYLGTSSSYILAGNHTGFLDSFILVAACPTMLYFLMERSVYQWKFVGPVLRLLPNLIPVRQGAPRKGLAGAVSALNNNKPLVIFPEGKLTRDGALNPFKRGVFRLQDATHKPIIPFTITGGFKAWGWGKWLPTFHPIHLTFHPPITPNSAPVSNRGYCLQQQVAQAL